MARSTRQLLLERAAELMGRRDLAIRLGVTEGLLEGWMTGHIRMPDRKFLALADLLDRLGTGKAPDL
jgi:hypothetical protein